MAEGGQGQQQQQNTKSQPQQQAEKNGDLEAAWENLETSRVIIQKKIEKKDYGDEEKIKLLKQQALIHHRLGAALAWQDEFKQAIQEYTQCLALREQACDAKRSRDVAGTLYTIGITLCYLNDNERNELGLEPVDFFKRAAEIFENLIKENYEKRGVQLPAYQVIKLVSIFLHSLGGSEWDQGWTCPGEWG